jgi:hypothetical protein
MIALFSSSSISCPEYIIHATNSKLIEVRRTNIKKEGGGVSKLNSYREQGL